MTTRTGYDVVLFADAGSVAHSRSLGPYRVATELRKQGFTVKVVDHFSSWLSNFKDFFKLINLIVDQKTLFIGFSGSTFNNTTSNEKSNIQRFSDYLSANRSMAAWPVDDNKITVLFAQIKKQFPNVKLVYGGSGAENKIHHLREHIDFLVQGYAEHSVVQLARHLSDGTNKISYLPVGKLKLINYDITAAEFDFRNHGATIYETSDILMRDEMLYMEVSRGCMFKCGFCSYPMLGRGKNNYAYHKSIDVLADEFKRNYDLAGITKYSFIDSIFNETTEKIQDVLRARDQSGVDINFTAFLRYELLARYPEQIQLLKELGLKIANLGIESLHTPSARTVGKGTDSEKVKDILYDLKAQWGNDIPISGSFIIGLPHETLETLEKWVPWVLNKDSPIILGYIFPLSFSNGAVFSESPEKYGYTVDGDQWKNDYWDYNSAEKYVTDLRTECWNSGSLRFTGFEFMMMMGLGYDTKFLTETGLNKIPWSEVQEKNQSRWNSYRDSTFAHETSKNNK